MDFSELFFKGIDGALETAAEPPTAGGEADGSGLGWAYRYRGLGWAGLSCTHGRRQGPRYWAGLGWAYRYRYRGLGWAEQG